MKRTILGVVLALAFGSANAMSVGVHVSAPHVSVHVAEVPHISESVHVTEEAPHVSATEEETPSVPHGYVSEEEAQRTGIQSSQQLQTQIALSNAQNARVMAEYASEASGSSADDVVPGITHRDVLLASIAGALFLGVLIAILLFSEKRNG